MENQKNYLNLLNEIQIVCKENDIPLIMKIGVYPEKEVILNLSEKNRNPEVSVILFIERNSLVMDIIKRGYGKYYREGNPKHDTFRIRIDDIEEKENLFPFIIQKSYDTYMKSKNDFEILNNKGVSK